MLRSAAIALSAIALVACQKKDDTASTTSAVTSAAPAVSSVATTPANDAPTTMLKQGDAAPDVDFKLQDGKDVKLSSLAGKMVVVYFYPKDETTGCTIEAQDFRDRFPDLVKAGISVIGVSTQDAASHQAFIAKEKLPFDLAVDTDGSLAKAFGVPLKSSLSARQTFLIGKDGKVKKVWRDVTPKDHAAAVLAAAQS